MRGLLDVALSQFGGLDIVVNNAGTTHRNQPMLDVAEEEFDRIYAVNVKSLFLTASHACRTSAAKRNGVFITIASTAGVRPRPGLTWYNGSKGAAIMTAARWRPSSGRTTSASTSSIRWRATPVLVTEFMGEDTPEKRAKFVATIPLGRLSQPSDIATAACSSRPTKRAFITGACLEVDGGRCV